MSKSTPSLLALLGLVAVAGYQNRGRISEMLADAQKGSQGSGLDRQQAGKTTETTGDSGGFLAEIGSLFGVGSSSGTLAAGLGDLVNRFKETGHAAPADSWVSTRANMPVDERELEDVLGDDTLEELGQKTGLSRHELLSRLNKSLPEVVNRFTPDGRLPNEADARSFE